MILAETLPVKCKVVTCNCVATDTVRISYGCRIDVPVGLSRRIMVHSNALFWLEQFIIVFVLLIVFFIPVDVVVPKLEVVVAVPRFPNWTRTVPCMVPGDSAYVPVQEADIFCTNNCNWGDDDDDTSRFVGW